jgi:CRP-like cAMP-binding protein
VSSAQLSNRLLAALPSDELQRLRHELGMLIQSVACNGLHTAEERCCRWLLMTHDRVGRDEFGLTHELLSMLLGVRRPTVTLVLSQLAKAGMISRVRGRMRIAHGPSLEAASCECYGVVQRLFDRVLPTEQEVALRFPMRSQEIVPEI